MLYQRKVLCANRLVVRIIHKTLPRGSLPAMPISVSPTLSHFGGLTSRDVPREEIQRSDKSVEHSPLGKHFSQG